MANKQVTLKRVTDTSGNTDNIYPTTEWAQIESKPTTFTPTDHTHDNSDIVSTGVTDGYVLTADGSGGTAWEAPTGGSGGVGLKFGGSVDLSAGTTEANAIGVDTLFTEVTYSNFTTTADDYINTYKIVNEPGWVKNGAGTQNSVAYYEFRLPADGSQQLDSAIGEEGDNTSPIQLEQGDWIVLTAKRQPTGGVRYYTFSIVNNSDPRFANYVAKSGDTMTGDLTISSTYPRINLTDTNHNSDYSIINNDGSLGFYDTTNSAYRMHILAGGNVGIGTTSPSEKLDVVGNVKITGTTTVDNVITLNRATGAYGATLTFAESGTPKWFLKDDFDGGNANRLQLANGSQALIATFEQGGNVGIGTTRPERSLHIDAGTAGGATIESDNDSTLRFTTTNGGTKQWQVGNYYTTWNGLTTPFIIQPLNTGMDMALTPVTNTPTSGIVIKNSGNVGIGTTSPSAKLHLSDAATSAVTTFNANGRITMSGDGVINWGSTAQYGQLTWNTNQAIVRAQSSTALHLGANGNSNHMVINTSGNVGIGTSSPGSTLDVAGDIQANRLYDRNNTAYYVDSASTSVMNAVSYNVLDGPTSQTRDKIRVWSGGTYTIGMKSGYTYGGLNDYAMSFQMNDDNDRGFWWGDSAHSDAQGAMSLTTNGNLVVANSILVGEGEGYTSAASDKLDVRNGDIGLDRGQIIRWNSAPGSGTGEYIYSKAASPYDVTIHSGSYDAIQAPNTGAVRINYQGTQRLVTTSNGVNINGALEVEGAIYDVETDFARIIKPNGGYYTNGSSSVTGAIGITLPNGTQASYTMMSFWVDIYDYAGGTDGESWTLHCGGYTNDGNSWYNEFANLISGRTDRFFNVRFNYNTTSYHSDGQTIYIGEDTSNWAYPKVIVRDIMVGHAGGDVAAWYNNPFGITIGSITGSNHGIKTAENVASYSLNSGQLGGLPASSFAASSHTHDDRYYTETESDARFVQQGGTSFTGTYPLVARIADRNFYSDGDITFTGSTSTLAVTGPVTSGGNKLAWVKNGSTVQSGVTFSLQSGVLYISTTA